MPALAFSAAYAEDIRLKSKQAPHVLERIADRLRRTNSSAGITTKILEGEPDAVILHEAEEWNADLIVLGTHDRGMLGKAVKGSIAHTVAEKATCRVEIIDVRW